MSVNGEFARKWSKYIRYMSCERASAFGVRTPFEPVRMRSGKSVSLPNPEPNFGRSVRVLEPSMDISTGNSLIAMSCDRSR